MLSQKDIEFYNAQGYLHIPEVFTSEETDALAEDLEWMIHAWARRDQGWTGPWRRAYMDEETEQKSQLVSMHDLSFYANSWVRGVTHPKLAAAMVDLIGPNVELHHSTMHVKPPENGHPFPMHQDWAFYEHVDARYVDALVHLDDTCHENGEIRFLVGSHKAGPLEHIRETDEGPCTPQLPTDRYRLEDTVPVSARRGDVVVFNIFTVHGSHINQTGRSRRLVRLGYRDPENAQTEGQSAGRPGLMVAGRRPRAEGQELFSINGPIPEDGEVHGVRAAFKDTG